MKVALVGPSEIISIQDDSAVYARQSLGAWTLGYPPGYPIWLAFCRIFDIPQRFAIEALYLAAALTVSYAVRKWLGWGSGYVTFTLLAFSSSTIFLFNLGLADGLFACLTLFALGFSIRIFEAREVPAIAGWALGLGVTLGTMAITRSEDPLLALWVILLVGFSAVVWRHKAAPLLRWDVWRKPFLAGVITSAIAPLVIWSLCLSYYFADGVFARGLALIPGHVKLLNNLAQIYTAEPPRRFVPISRKSRELAYAVSPAFAKYRPLIENPSDGWQVLSRDSGIPNGEIGGGWIWHAINTKVMSRCGGRPAHAEAEYRKINADIQKAFIDGRLKRRFIFHPLIGGDPVNLLTELPPSIIAVVDSTFSSTPENRNDQDFDAPLFDTAFVRRASLILHAPEVAVQGWAFVNKPGHKILNLTIGSQGSKAQLTTQDRLDVVNAFGAQNGWRPAVIAFHGDLRSRTAAEVKITYLLDDGSRVQSDNLKSNQVKQLENKSVPGDDVVQGIDVVEIGGDSQPEQEIRHRAEVELFGVSQSRTTQQMGIGIVFLAFVLAIGAFFRSRDAHWKRYFVLVAFVFVLVCSRILFYSVLDARAWPGDQIRYLAPAHVLWLVIIAASISALISFVSRARWPNLGRQVRSPVQEAGSQ